MRPVIAVLGVVLLVPGHGSSQEFKRPDGLTPFFAVVSSIDSQNGKVEYVWTGFLPVSQAFLSEDNLGIKKWETRIRLVRAERKGRFDITTGYLLEVNGKHFKKRVGIGSLKIGDMVLVSIGSEEVAPVYLELVRQNVKILVHPNITYDLSEDFFGPQIVRNALR